MPDCEGLVTAVSVFSGGDEMTAGVEGVVGRRVQREESLRCTGRPEALHLSFSTANVDMRSFDAIVLPTSLMMPGRQSKISEGRSVGTKLVRDDGPWRETALLYQLSHELQRGSPIMLGLDEDI